MADLTPEQKRCVAAFETLDKIIKQCTLPVEQGVALARAFGEAAASTDYLMSQAAGPKLKAVPAIDQELEDAKAMARAEVIS